MPINCPNNEAFKTHFKENMHETEICDLSDCLDIAVLEAFEVIFQMKADKAPDLNGIPPGLIKLLPFEFIMIIIYFKKDQQMFVATIAALS